MDWARLLAVAFSATIASAAHAAPMFNRLGYLPGGNFQSVGLAISADGTTVVGVSDSAQGSREAFRWSAADGLIGLGDLRDGFLESRASDVSGDGSVVVGASFVPQNVVANDVSADGSVIVGDGVGAEMREAFIWDETHGMRTVQGRLENELGLDLSGWTLIDVQGISDDGRALTGTGINPSGRYEAWYAVIPEPGTALLLGTGSVLLSTGRSVSRRRVRGGRRAHGSGGPSRTRSDSSRSARRSSAGGPSGRARSASHSARGRLRARSRRRASR